MGQVLSENIILHLENEMSRIYGEELRCDYKICGQVKFEKKMLDPSLLRSGFEVVVRRPPQKEFDKHMPITFAVNMGLNAPVTMGYNVGMDGAPDYLNIGASLTDGIEGVGAEWTSFTVTACRDQFIFAIGNETKYYNFKTAAEGGFCFRASNCAVELKDVRYEALEQENPEGGIASLSVVPAGVCVNVFDIVQLKELAAVSAQYENGATAYLSDTDGISWAVCSADGAAEVLQDTNSVRFSPEAEEGAEVQLECSCQGKTAFLTLRLTHGGMTRPEYVRATMKKRQMSTMFIMRRGFESNFCYDEDMYPEMARRTRQIAAKIMLDPNEQNYDRQIHWMVDVSRWELEQKGHGLAMSDFFQIQMLLIRKLLYGKSDISQEAWDYLEDYLKKAEYCTEEYVLSENHLLTYLGAGMVASEMWPDNVMWNGKAGRENIQLYKKAISKLLTRRMKYGWIEFNGLYFGTSAIALVFIADWVEDAETKQLAVGALEVLLAAKALHSLDGMSTGAKSRAYNGVYLEAGMSVVAMLTGESMGNIKEDYPALCNTIVMPLSKYVPTDLVIAMAADRKKEFIQRERASTFHIPDDPSVTESVKTYLYQTPDYAMGAINQYDMVPGLDKDLRRRHSDPNIEGVWVPQGHQEMAWSLYLGRTKEGMILDGHPGGTEADRASMHNYWTGDTGCMDYRYFQNENVLLGMHKIVKPDELQFTHFYIPTQIMDRIEEIEGWIFLQKGPVFVGMKPLKDGVVSGQAQYSWTKGGLYEGIEARVDSPETAFVCEVVSTTQYPKGFSEFCKELAEKKIHYQAGQDAFIEYKGLNGKTMRLEYEGNVSKIDGEEIDYKSYPLYGSPYMQSKWGSGVTDLYYGGKALRIRQDGRMIDIGGKKDAEKE